MSETGRLIAQLLEDVLDASAPGRQISAPSADELRRRVRRLLAAVRQAQLLASMREPHLAN